MAFLPRFILLKSTNVDKYLRYRKEDDSNHGLLEFSQDVKEENPEIRYVIFEVQKSETVEGFVHIRSCYNNKYWVRKSGDAGSKWIAAEANEPEEDPSKWSCTLFKPVLVDSPDGADVAEPKPQKIRLVHTEQVGQHACVAVALPGSDLRVLGVDVDDQAAGSRTSGDDVFIAYDGAYSWALPEVVAFVGHTGQYGAVTTVGGFAYLEFKTNDIGTVGVAHDINVMGWDPMLGRPQLRVRNRSAGWWSTRTLVGYNVFMQPSVGSAWTLFVRPIRLGGNRIALELYDTNNIAGFATYNPGAALLLDQMLHLGASSINQTAIFEVEEPVHDRRVSNMNYNLSDSRTYNISSVEKYRDERRNSTSVEQTGTFSVSYTISETRSWNDSVSVTSGVSASMSASIPFVGISLGVELSHESSQSVTWGAEQSEERTVAFQQNLTIPPGKKMTVLVVGTRAQCDVPFTCRVVDTLSDGTVRDYTKNDGLFTGSNEFGFDTHLLEEDL